MLVTTNDKMKELEADVEDEVDAKEGIGKVRHTSSEVRKVGEHVK